MNKHRFLAIDIGAESGRAVAGTLKNNVLTLKEIYRFPNGPVNICGTLYWDVLSLHNHITHGMREYVNQYGNKVEGIGIDTWGVDFGLLDKNGSLLQNPVCYRDKRTNAISDEISSMMPLKNIFELTGLTFQPFYTLGQLLSVRLDSNHLLATAETFLMMPDLLAYFLTGKKFCERSNAVSTQLYDPRKGDWCEDIFGAFDLPISIMPEIIDPGTILGELQQSVKKDVKLEQAVVVAPCSHDTPSAVAAVPGRGDDWAFISSGTWSVVGALNDDVVTTDQVCQSSFVNELTIDGFFLCRNIMGLWLLQRARAAWQKQGDAYSYEQLVELSRKAPANGPLLHPDHSGFLSPDDMCRTIGDYCRETGQSSPESPGQIARCILESLALSYRNALDQLKSILDRSITTIHVVGGGSLNTLLCQFIANATGAKVVVGPVEATIAGNILTQALALGVLSSPAEIRQVARQSASLQEYQPQDSNIWQSRYTQYLDIAKP